MSIVAEIDTFVAIKFHADFQKLFAALNYWLGYEPRIG